MKNSKFMIAIMLIIYGSALLAKNKQIIELQNDFGQDIVVCINWRADKSSAHKFDYILIEKDKKIAWKAPISTYHLFSVATAPASILNRPSTKLANNALATTGATATIINMAHGQGATSLGTTGFVIGAGAAILNITTLTANTIITILNRHKVDGHGHSFFIIENTGKKSKVIGQKEIRIKGYTSHKHYEDEIARVNNTMAQSAADIKVVENIENNEVQIA